MSWQALAWVTEQAEMTSSSQKFVLVALANFAGESGMSYPSVATICDFTCLDHKTVRGALDSLVEQKIIEDTGKKAGNTQQIKVYRLPKPTWSKDYQKRVSLKPEDSRKTPERLQEDSRKVPKNGNLPYIDQPGTGNQETEIELPSGFPKTIDDAVSRAETTGASIDFITKTWTKARGRGGRDSREVQIRSWPHYVSTEWSYEQRRVAEQINGSGRMNGADTVKFSKELDRVLLQISDIKSSYADSQTMGDSDRTKLKSLRDRQAELKKILGVKV